MHINWLSVARIGSAMVNIAVPGVAAVENLAEKVGSVTGAQKEDAVIDLVKQSLITAEGLTATDLINNTAVEVALRDVIQTIHALHQAVASAHLGSAAGAGTSGTTT